MTREAVKPGIVEFVCRNFLVEEHEIDFDESLVDQGIIDSFGLVEIATFIRKTWGLETEQSEMNRDNFGSITKIAAYVERKADG
jgi:acyl carrier protein